MGLALLLFLGISPQAFCTALPPCGSRQASIHIDTVNTHFMLVLTKPYRRLKTFQLLLQQQTQKLK